MKIAIEAQRIFRPSKHGMDFVALETIRELQKRNDGNQYFVIVAPGEDRCLEESSNLSIVGVEMSHISALGTNSSPKSSKAFRSRLIALHLEYSPFALFGSSRTDTP